MVSKDSSKESVKCAVVPLEASMIEIWLVSAANNVESEGLGEVLDSLTVFSNMPLEGVGI